MKKNNNKNSNKNKNNINSTSEIISKTKKRKLNTSEVLKKGLIYGLAIILILAMVVPTIYGIVVMLKY